MASQHKAVLLIVDSSKKGLNKMEQAVKEERQTDDEDNTSHISHISPTNKHTPTYASRDC